MTQKLFLKYLSVYLSSALKFIGGIILGTIEQLNFVEIALFTFLGSMTTISLIAYLGNKYRNELAHFFWEVKFSYIKIKLFMALKMGNVTQSQSEAYTKLINIELKPRKFTKTTRYAVKTWSRFGLWGICILTPILLSPIGGALVAVSYKVKTSKIIFYMSVVHIVASLFLAYIFVEFKDLIHHSVGINLISTP